MMLNLHPKTEVMEQTKRPPYPFERIALAVSLSSSLQSSVEEAFRMAVNFGAELYFIHVGNEDNARLIQDRIIRSNHDNRKFNFIVTQGDVVDALLECCKKLQIDLLVAGALERENPYKYYLGSVSRTLCRKAKCSVLMLKEPIEQPLNFSKIVVNCADSPKTQQTIKTAIYFAKNFNLPELNIIHENHVNSLSAVFQQECTEEIAEKLKENEVEIERLKLLDMIKDIDFEGIKPKAEYIFAKPGLGISNYTRKIKADLLVVNSPDKQLGIIDRIFPHDLEYTLENLPSSLLIVHSRVE